MSQKKPHLCCHQDLHNLLFHIPRHTARQQKQFNITFSLTIFSRQLLIILRNHIFAAIKIFLICTFTSQDGLPDSANSSTYSCLLSRYSCLTMTHEYTVLRSKTCLCGVVRDERRTPASQNHGQLKLYRPEGRRQHLGISQLRELIFFFLSLKEAFCIFCLQKFSKYVVPVLPVLICQMCCVYNCDYWYLV